MLSGAKVYAQHQISGRIIQTEGNAPLEFANVALAGKDSTYQVTGTTSNTKGTFQLKNIPSGDYELTVSYLGFHSKTVSINGLSKSIDLGDIILESEANLLETVTVTGSNTTNKTDHLIVFITDQQKKNSSNGISLLNNLQLPRLIVNPMTNQVSLPGEESVQFCINGIKVELSDIRGLQPNDIIRVEYLDNPGLRYGNAGAVINYILKRETSGGSVSMDLSNGLTTSFGDDQIAGRFNYKKSEFGLIYSVRYRNPTEVWNNENRTFHFDNGTSLERIDKGLPGDLSENSHNIALNYNLLNEKSYFNATVRYSIADDDKIAHTHQYTAANPANITDVLQGSNSRQQLPVVDLYYSQSLKNKQTLMFNLVGTYIKSDINQKYEETKGEELITDIISDVEGKKYSIIGEGIYEKIFENSNRLSGGLKHTQAFANNDYTGKVNSKTKMDQSETYIYAEYAGKVKKFNYTGGIGVSRSWVKQKGEDDYTFYTFRPKFTLQYNFTPAMFLRLRGEIYNTSPSLSRISAVDQYIDTLQIMRGNPGLEPNLNYVTNMLFSWRKGGYGIHFNASYHYCPDAIMEETLRENNMFIQTYSNQKSWQKFNSELTINGQIIKNFLNVSLTGGVNRYLSRGNDYSHSLTNFYYRAFVSANYKKLMAIFQANSAYDHLAGESFNGGEKIHMFMLMYNAGKFTAGAGIMMPFSDQYKREGESRNKYTPMKTNMYANDFSRMVMVKFTWNFSYGRKLKGGNKRINNEDRDSGIMIKN